MAAIIIEEWHAGHPRWNELGILIDQLEQTDWVCFVAGWHLSSHMLVAATPACVVGFLRYVIQEIGVEEDLPPVTLNSTVLTEGKVLAFGVARDMRRQGIGRRLQQQLIHDCRIHGCFQIRSHSSAKNVENHRLKLSLGYAIQPLIPTANKDGAYFLLPLRALQPESVQENGESSDA